MRLNTALSRYAMPSLGAAYPSIVQSLADHFGRRKPAEMAHSPLAGVLAAGLTGSGEQAGAGKYLEALDRAGLLQAEALAAIEPTELLDTLRDQGVTLPARPAAMLKRLAGWFASRFPDEDDAGDEAAWPTTRLHQELTALSGIGQAKADAILLYGLGRPVYPVDRGTYRVLVRHGWIDPWADYDEVSQLLTHATGELPGEISRLSDWMTAVAKDFCKPGSPRCQNCPLKPLLPEQGPLQPD
jgi:endonuclease-3 related protein